MSRDIEWREDRWEYGSEFHWPSFHEPPSAPVVPADAVLFASGRDAFAALIRHGSLERGWRRWFVPSYFCPDVAAAIAATGVEIVLYEDLPCWPGPVQPAVPFRAGDVFLLVNYFGLRGRQAAGAIDLGAAELVEDHTHDPWSDWAQGSAAAYCVASLRKTLPIPDGAALWSPSGHSLPGRAAVTAARGSASRKKLAAMLLKRLYLEGQFADKPAFRRLQVEGESGLGVGPVSGASRLVEQLLPILPWDVWRQRRAASYETLRQALEHVAGIRALGRADAGSCPLALILECRTPELRERLRKGLIAAAMYPAVHWPIERRDCAALQSAERLAQLLLTLPCDFRYDSADLLRVADVVQRLARDAV